MLLLRGFTGDGFSVELLAGGAVDGLVVFGLGFYGGVSPERETGDSEVFGCCLVGV